ncbi:MAG: phosphotransferase family protein [Acidimicrobiales bacterium]
MGARGTGSGSAGRPRFHPAGGLLIDLAEALSGRAGSQAIQAVLRSRAHREQLAGLLGGVSCRTRLRRVNFKPNRRLSAYYEVYVDAPGRPVRWVAVTWTPPVTGDTGAHEAGSSEPRSSDPGSGETLDGLLEEAADRGALFPFVGLHSFLPAEGLRLQVSPFDPAFSHLLRLCDPAHVASFLPSGAEGPISVRAVRYRPGQRHVLRYRRGSGPGMETIFAKVARPPEPLSVPRPPVPAPAGQAGSEGMSRQTGSSGTRRPETGPLGPGLTPAGPSPAGSSPAGPLPAGDERGVAAQRPGVAGWAEVAARQALSSGPDDLCIGAASHWIRPDRVSLYPRVAGRPLLALLVQKSPQAAGGLFRAGSLLARLHTEAPAGPSPLSHRHAHQEAAAARRAGSHVTGLLPHLTGTVDGILDRSLSALAEMGGAPSLFAHGDFKAEHVFVTPTRATLIDFDSATLADPAFDLGKFLADLRIRFRLGDRDDLDATVSPFLAGYGLSPASDLARRVEAFETIFMVKLAARRVRVDHPAWSTSVTSLLAEAEALSLRLGLMGTTGPR